MVWVGAAVTLSDMRPLNLILKHIRVSLFQISFKLVHSFLKSGDQNSILMKLAHFLGFYSWEDEHELSYSNKTLLLPTLIVIISRVFHLAWFWWYKFSQIQHLSGLSHPNWVLFGKSLLSSSVATNNEKNDSYFLRSLNGNRHF